MLSLQLNKLWAVPWWLVLVSVYVMEIMALATHWAGHRRWSGWWYKAHMGHHLSDYPASRFMTDRYHSALHNNSWAYYPSMLLTPCIVHLFLPQWNAAGWLISFLYPVFVLWVADKFHVAFHTEGHSLERYDWFLKLRHIHFYHHIGSMKQNYAVGDFLFDYLFLGLKLH